MNLLFLSVQEYQWVQDFFLGMIWSKKYRNVLVFPILLSAIILLSLSYIIIPEERKIIMN